MPFRGLQLCKEGRNVEKYIYINGKLFLKYNERNLLKFRNEQLFPSEMDDWS